MFLNEQSHLCRLRSYVRMCMFYRHDNKLAARLLLLGSFDPIIKKVIFFYYFPALTFFYFKVAWYFFKKFVPTFLFPFPSFLNLFLSFVNSVILWMLCIYHASISCLQDFSQRFLYSETCSLMRNPCFLVWKRQLKET